jgi:hypothetical protein
METIVLDITTNKWAEAQMYLSHNYARKGIDYTISHNGPWTQVQFMDTLLGGRFLQYFHPFIKSGH